MWMVAWQNRSEIASCDDRLCGQASQESTATGAASDVVAGEEVIGGTLTGLVAADVSPGCAAWEVGNARKPR
jgi:hypothetical protein